MLKTFSPKKYNPDIPLWLQGLRLRPMEVFFYCYQSICVKYVRRQHVSLKTVINQFVIKCVRQNYVSATYCSNSKFLYGASKRFKTIPFIVLYIICVNCNVMWSRIVNHILIKMITCYSIKQIRNFQHIRITTNEVICILVRTWYISLHFFRIMFL